jgi:hypothetical protein
MNKPLVIEPEAEADIAAAHRWYEQRREGLGDDFLLCVEAALHAIAERPKSFPRIHKSARRVLMHRFLMQCYLPSAEILLLFSRSFIQAEIQEPGKSDCEYEQMSLGQKRCDDRLSRSRMGRAAA